MASAGGSGSGAADGSSSAKGPARADVAAVEEEGEGRARGGGRIKKVVGFAEEPTVRVMSLRADEVPPPSAFATAAAATTTDAASGRVLNDSAGRAASPVTLAAKVAAAGGASPPPPSGAAAAAEAKGGVGGSMRSNVPLTPHLLADLQLVLMKLFQNQHQALTVEQLQQGLLELGHHLAPTEVAHLAQEVGLGDGDVVGLSQFAASQLDWVDFQVNHREEWMRCLKATFEDLDKDKDGVISTAEIMKVLADKLPEGEVRGVMGIQWGSCRMRGRG